MDYNLYSYCTAVQSKIPTGYTYRVTVFTRPVPKPKPSLEDASRQRACSAATTPSQVGDTLREGVQLRALQQGRCAAHAGA